MTKEELENNLGTIARSGSLSFKEENEKKEDIDIIGQFGVGFYSAFMVANIVTVYSKSIDSDEAYVWTSKGAEGYTIEPCERQENGTKIVLNIKENSDEEKYDLYLDQYGIEEIIKKYSDYIRYPIKMEMETSKLKEGSKDEYEKVKEVKTLNSMIPIWKRKKSEVKLEEYNEFYKNKFYDFEDPLKVIYSSVEGSSSYNALMFIPSKLPFNYYTKEFEKGLQLYSNGVLIMDKCSDLLPDYFSFVKGLVDSQDLSLNISRELLQHDRQLKVIAKSIEKKINNELQTMLKDNRKEYEKFFEAFGMQLKFGTYNNYGMEKDKLKDLLLFYSSTKNGFVTLKEYVANIKEGQDSIYYASGETVDKINLLPQVENVKDKGYEILYLTENVDEFVFQILMEYEGKKFVNVASENVDLDSEEEKKKLEKSNEVNKSMFEEMKKILCDSVTNVRFTHRLKNHPVCLGSMGPISIEMEKVINSMPNGEQIKADTILEINENHKIAEKLKDLYANNKEEFEDCTKVLYSLARLIEGLPIENPTEVSNLVCKLLA